MSRYDAFEGMEIDQVWDLFIELAICSEETLDVVTSINGYSMETMYDILYATTGLRNFEQLANEYGLDINDYIDVDED